MRPIFTNINVYQHNLLCTMCRRCLKAKSISSCFKKPNIGDIGIRYSSSNGRDYISRIRGMGDVYGDTMSRQQYIRHAMESMAKRYCFKEIQTPIVEKVELYKRTLGEESDVVSKEMFTLTDRKKSVLALRPENTAGIARAVVSNAIPATSTNPCNAFYFGPMFRYERPQKGRYRQFHQAGIECIGSSDTISDIFTIQTAVDFLQQLQLLQFTELRINTLGDSYSRGVYSNKLKEYLDPRLDELSPLSRKRVENGHTLRFLDSKEEKDMKYKAECPSILDFISDESRLRWNNVLSGLDALGIKYTVDPTLVRGLDYYNHTCFEFIDISRQSHSQSAVLAGGRYDGLLEVIAGRNNKYTGAMGWAAGVERLEDLLFEKKNCFDKGPRRVIIVSIYDLINETESNPNDATKINKEVYYASLKLATKLRKNNINTELLSYDPSNYSTTTNSNTNSTSATHPFSRKSLKYFISYSIENDASMCIFIGSQELKQNEVKIKVLDTHEEHTLSWDNVVILAKQVSNNL